MAMSKHTPAPWIVNDSVHGPGNGIVHVQSNDPFEQDICTVWGASLVKPDQYEANARLIAAAPDLLVALKSLSAAVFHPNAEGAPSLALAAEMSLAAILKAEGGA